MVLTEIIFIIEEEITLIEIWIIENLIMDL